MIAAIDPGILASIREETPNPTAKQKVWLDKMSDVTEEDNGILAIIKLK